MEGRVTALKNAGARRRRSKNQEMPPPTKRAEVGASATSVGVRSILRKSIVACTEVLSFELRLMAATIGAARGDGKN